MRFRAPLEILSGVFYVKFVRRFPAKIRYVVLYGAKQ
jgi:hypothetical protein